MLHGDRLIPSARSPRNRLRSCYFLFIRENIMSTKLLNPAFRRSTHVANVGLLCRGIVALFLLVNAWDAQGQAISHWALNEAVAGPVVDSVGGFDGTNSGATINQSGQFGTAYDFDGANDFVNIGNLPAFDFDYNTPFTVSAWVRRDGTGTRSILSKVNPVANFDGWVVAQRTIGANQALSFSLGATTANRLLIESDVTIPGGTLSHVLVTYDGSGTAGGVKQYINGLPVSTTATTNNPVGSALNVQPVTIGSYAGANRFFDGAIDDVGVFGQALTYSQVRSVFQNGVAAFNAGATVGGNVVVASYDGSYAPNSPTPPPGQTTWSVFDNIGGADILPNSPAPGLANFNDNSTGGRLSIFDTLTDSMLVDQSWTMETRMRINSLNMNPGVFIATGVRDEGGSGGKNAMLGFNSDGSLFIGNASQSVSTEDFVDGLFHTYRVEKFEDDGDFFIQVFVDGDPQFGMPLDYSALVNQSDVNNGIGYFSSTPGLSNIDIDYLNLNITLASVPEPQSLAIWGLVVCASVGMYWHRCRRSS